MTTLAERKWVQCPACSEPDMRQENGVIHCTNEACPSYGGSIQMTETVRKMKGDVNPLKVFYIALTVDNLDGSADVDWDGSTCSECLRRTRVRVHHLRMHSDQASVATEAEGRDAAKTKGTQMKWKRRRHDGYDEHVNGFTLDFWVFFNIWDCGIERRFALPDILKIGPLRFTLEKKWREDRAAKGEMIWRWPFAKRRIM